MSPVTFISDASLSEQCYQSEIRKAVIVTRLGAVVIGRNEGERFRRCLKSLRESVSPIVYVDSGSTDGSVAYAREHDVDVVELDSSIPFTAARGRNAGFDRIRELAPNAELVMFVDGDCEVTPEWLPAAETSSGSMRTTLSRAGGGVSDSRMHRSTTTCVTSNGTHPSATPMHAAETP